jgi:uncharacterized protein (TIGR04255 family)
MAAHNDPAVRHYNRAPIVQASFDFHIEPFREDQAEPAIAEILAALAPHYSEPVVPQARPNAERELERPNARTTVDRLNVVDPRIDGFEFSRFAPYTDWETFSAEARRTWAVFTMSAAKVAEPPKLAGLTVRYLNRLRLPFGEPLWKFLTVYPASPDRNTLFTKLFVFYGVETTDPPGHLTVSLMPGRKADEESFFIYLDNDFEFDVTDEAKLWDSLSAIRKLKNDTFESQLTHDFKETLL